MAVDPKQILGAFLTFSMFAMLANMIKEDHFDSPNANVKPNHPGPSDVQYEKIRITEPKRETLPKKSTGPWAEDGIELKPCWTRPAPKEAEQSGFVTFSLMHGPEYHISQIADAVVVARYLGATLVLPDIRGSTPGDKRNFDEVYNVEKFVEILDGVVKVTKDQPAEIAAGKIAVVKVPNRVTEDHIAEQIEPILRMKRNIRLVTYFPSVNMRKAEEKKDLDSVACLAMFGTLQLEPELQEVVDLMIERLRTSSRKSGSKFIAVDLRVDILEKKACQGRTESGRKSCYDALEIGVFLRKIGFQRDTTIYLTQSKWHDSLDALKEFFPKTYTKDSIIPGDKKHKFLGSGGFEIEKVLDFYICSQSDVFVPAISGLFYANVAGKRIASGKTQILVPSEVSSTSASAADFISSYVSKKNHLAHSCFC
ncbi:protein MANNAN SYNTHESIS-RELATED 1-like [Macadamia integrifolia]|uniref:protein MANNAN SYNTHESIS-RELATED 1-like n=1 Tax=Macadamia integrifolia TaxID=60698 RepID=UPI001C501658|nr:protein MANNAN SYNTHESIS-RELATED 1-like [Macadamia integrifolia]